MKVTVKDCLELAAFDKAGVLAGKNDLGRAVKKISVLEATDAKDVASYYNGKDQMLFTSFFGMRANEDAQCRAIEVLAKNEAAALVIFNVGKVVKQISRKVVNTAERAGLPLIAMNPGSKLDMGDVITEVSGKLLMGDDDFENALINNAVFHLLNFEKYTSFPEAAKAAALSNDFQLILLSSDFNPVLSVETRHRTTIAEAIRLGKERDVENAGTVYTMIDVNGVLTYWGPVTIQGKKHFMFIVDNEDSYSAGEITKLAEIIELAMGMWKYTPERDSRAELIKALRRGNMSLAYSMKDEAEIDPADIVSVFFGKGMEEGHGHEIMEEFENTEALSIMRIIEDDETYGMILSEGSEKDDKATCIELFNRLKGDRSSRIFHITGVDGIEGAGEAYRLINESWSFAGNVFPYKRVFTKYELVLISNCINIQLQGGRVKKNYTELLSPFDENNAKGKQLLDTLLTFVLDAGMNSGKTAEFMDIHTNTVQYRLKKINDVLGVEITGNRVMPGLTIALALKRLEKVVRQ
ncbi:MAG: PucR family transcriptional regulator ligand-binding domain-containing protein [Eubacteriaceae bacterium]|nr:PucR family transcriptional regulator ligand-binding domain-containing protein [Eubacteriaceae bacterium]